MRRAIYLQPLSQQLTNIAQFNNNPVALRPSVAASLFFFLIDFRTLSFPHTTFIPPSLPLPIGLQLCYHLTHCISFFRSVALCLSACLSVSVCSLSLSLNENIPLRKPRCHYFVNFVIVCYIYFSLSVLLVSVSVSIPSSPSHVLLCSAPIRKNNASA